MTIVRFTLRIPIDLNEWLIRQASKHNRSRHREVINILTLAMNRNEAMGNSEQDEKWLIMKGEK